jgi:adenylate kinase
VFFGKPGAGKGTLSARLVEKYDVLSLSTGDMLRQHIAERTEVGRMAEEIVAHGGLLPDELMLQVVTTKLDALHDRHWILDGFPRTVGQSDLLDSHLQTHGTPLTLIANIDVPDQVILSRIADRWVHLPSGRVYNMQFNRPRVEGLDDVTGEPLSKRPDDNPETFARRLKQFYTSTSPLLEHYASQAHSAPLLTTLRGKTTAEIWPQLEEVIARRFPALKPRRTAHASISQPLPRQPAQQNAKVADTVLVSSLKKGAERAQRVGVKQMA